MKKLTALLLSLVLAMTVTACAGPEEVAYVTTVPTEERPRPTAAPTEPAAPEVEFSYEALKNYVFYFSSGAGGWQTELRVSPDGSFTGTWQDSNLGESGEGYTSALYRCNFTGRFGQPEPVNEYTLSLPIQALQTEEDRSEIVDGVLRHYGGEAYGLEKTDAMLLYLPGAPLAQLPEYFLRWVNLYETQEEALSFYGLYNETQESGFSSYNEIVSLREAVTAAEKQDAGEQDDMTQADMNISSYNRYEMWDGLLNQIWEQLMRRMEGSEKQALIEEERAWIEAKEAAVLEAGKEVEGGTLYPTVTNGTAANWTRDRVYVLMEKLEEIA